MRIAMFHPAPQGYPPDVRIAKEAAALRAAGHDVTILTARARADQPEREAMPGGEVVVRAAVRRPPRPARVPGLLTLRRPEWRAPLAAFLDVQRPDAFHVHDLPGVPTALDAALPRGIPVVADLHENMPAAYRAYRSAYAWPRRLAHALAYAYPLWRWHERRALARCARTIVVVPEAAERLVAGGLPPERIVVVSNTEDETTFDAAPEAADPAIAQRFAGDWVASYIGGIGPHRGLETAIDALPAALGRVPRLRLVVVGATERDRAAIEARARARGAAERTTVIGWQPFEAVRSFIHASDACLVPHADFEHTQTTVPHKLFQYMLCGRPVVVSDVRPLARIVGETGAGRVFRAGDPADLAEALVWLHDHPAEAAAMGAAGRAAALGPYAWRHDAARLVALYAGLEARAGG